MSIKKGDLVKVIGGKDKGKKGIVEISKGKMVVVKNINIYKKHYKPNSKSVKTGIKEISMPIDVSNVMIVCKNCQKPSKVKMKIIDKNKLRICKRCSEKIDE